METETSANLKRQRDNTESLESLNNIKRQATTGEVSLKTATIPEYAHGHSSLIKLALKGSCNEENALDSVDALMTLIAQLNVKCAKLEGKVEAMKTYQKDDRQKPRDNNPSYASAAKRLIAPKAQVQKTTIKTPNKVLIMKPKCGIKDPSDLDKVKTDLMKNFNPSKEKVQITNLRKTKVGLIIEAESEGDLDKIRNNKDLNEQFHIEKPSKSRPRIMIYDVPSDMTDQQVIQAVFEQNEGLIDSAKNLAMHFEPKFKTGKRQKETTTWVVEVSPEIRVSLLERRKIFIGWQSCKIHDYITVTKCYKCQGFGHIAKHCRNEQVCSHCTQTGHNRSDGPNKDKPKTCANCLRSKREHTHDTMDRKCPLYKQALDRLIKSTDYGQ